jgi:hypothetical protein
VCSLANVSSLSPAASHTVADTHATLERVALIAPAGASMDWLVHDEPWNPSAMYVPTAVHVPGDGHERPDTGVSALSGGATMALQALPFQLLAIWSPFDDPTAAHQVADGHDTVQNTPEELPVGMAAGSIVQADPFHNSVSGCSTPLGST